MNAAEFLDSGTRVLTIRSEFYSIGVSDGGPDEKDDGCASRGLTASGENLCFGVAAAHPTKGLPLGTLIRTFLGGPFSPVPRLSLVADIHHEAAADLVRFYVEPADYVPGIREAVSAIIGRIHPIPKTARMLALLLEEERRQLDDWKEDIG